MDGFDWGAIAYAVPYMLQGALVTLEISILAMLLATVVGLVMGLISASDYGVLKAIIRARAGSAPIRPMSISFGARRRWCRSS